jgi:hypothetical protein
MLASYRCIADLTGLPHSFGTDSLQTHLITHTGTPSNSNHNCLLRVYLRLSEENFLAIYMCTADLTGLPHSFGTDSLQTHLITHTGTPSNSNHNCLLRVYLRLSEENFLATYMCTADLTGLPHSFGTDSLQPHIITHTDTPGTHNCLLHVCMVTLSGKNSSSSYTCTTDPTGLPSLIGTDSLQSHLTNYTVVDTCLHSYTASREFFRCHIHAQPTQLAYRSHSVPTVCSHICIGLSKRNLLLVHMCAADPASTS